MLINATIKCGVCKFTITLRNKIHNKFMNLKSALNTHTFVSALDLKYIWLFGEF